MIAWRDLHGSGRNPARPGSEIHRSGHAKAEGGAGRVFGKVRFGQKVRFGRALGFWAVLFGSECHNKLHKSNQC